MKEINRILYNAVSQGMGERRVFIRKPQIFRVNSVYKRVENFLKDEALKIWGKKFDSEKYIQFFKTKI